MTPDMMCPPIFGGPTSHCDLSSQSILPLLPRSNWSTPSHTSSRRSSPLRRRFSCSPSSPAVGGSNTTVRIRPGYRAATPTNVERARDLDVNLSACCKSSGWVGPARAPHAVLPCIAALPIAATTIRRRSMAIPMAGRGIPRPRSTVTPSAASTSTTAATRASARTRLPPGRWRCPPRPPTPPAPSSASVATLRRAAERGGGAAAVVARRLRAAARRSAGAGGAAAAAGGVRAHAPRWGSGAERAGAGERRRQTARTPAHVGR